MYRVRRGSHRTVLFEALKLHKTLQMFLGSVPFEADSAALLCVLTVCFGCLGGKLQLHKKCCPSYNFILFCSIFCSLIFLNVF